MDTIKTDAAKLSAARCTTRCAHCGREIIFAEDDCHDDDDCQTYIICPGCGHKIHT